jgi:hypothetical protein
VSEGQEEVGQGRLVWKERTPWKVSNTIVAFAEAAAARTVRREWEKEGERTEARGGCG